jgi:hypothetical protein
MRFQVARCFRRWSAAVRSSLLVAALTALAACGLEPADGSGDAGLASGAQTILDAEVQEEGTVDGVYDIAVELTLQFAVTGSAVNRLTDSAVLRCFLSPGCQEVIDQIAKVDSAEELLDPRCDTWAVEHSGNHSTVRCRKAGWLGTIVSSGEMATITLEPDDGEVKEATARLPADGHPMVIDELLEELGEPIELYFTAGGFVGAREATADSTLAGEVLEALEEADLSADLLLDVVIRGRREGADLPADDHPLSFF